MGGLCHSYAGSKSDDQVERVVMFQSLEFWAFGGDLYIYICVVAASVGCCFGGFYKVILDMCSRVDVNKT